MDHWLEQFARAMFQRSADTAHDLKTPLNVAVLNLELLRMRVRKLSDGAEDEKLANYAKAIEVELRRMGRIFDTFFLLSSPPKAEEAPESIDVVPIAVESGAAHGFELTPSESAPVVVHEARIRQAVTLFFEGAAKAIDPAGRRVSVNQENGRFNLVVEGKAAFDASELSKVFKFYYTDPSGNPDLCLACARLIAETYGGEVNASEESDKVGLILSLPLGER
jgi:signal transduction histidine kinase